jgi:hypothetical protein
MRSVKKPPYIQGHLILQVNTVPVIRTDMVMVHRITHTKAEEKNNMTILTRSILQHVLNLQCNIQATNSEWFMMMLILIYHTLSTESYA